MLPCIILSTCILVITVILIVTLSKLLYTSFAVNVFIHTKYIPFIIFGFLLIIAFVAMLGFNLAATVGYNKLKKQGKFEWIILRRQSKHYRYNNFKEWLIFILNKTFTTFAIMSITIAITFALLVLKTLLAL